MANTIETQTLQDGDRNVVVHVHLEGDGTGDETNLVIVDKSGFANSGDFSTLRLKGIHADTVGFSAKLLWDGSSNKHFYSLPADSEIDQWYPDKSTFGGIRNNASSPTGDILITTSGFGSGDHGAITMWLTKH